MYPTSRYQWALLASLSAYAQAFPADWRHERDSGTERVPNPTSNFTTLFTAVMPFILLPHLTEIFLGSQALLKRPGQKAPTQAQYKLLPTWRPSIFTLRWLILRLPALAWLTCTVFALAWSSSQQINSSDSCPGPALELNPDIAGIGVRVAIYLPAAATFVSTHFYRSSTGQSGIKELGMAQLIILSYLVLNFLKSYSTMQGLDLIVACVSIDTVSAAVFATFSQKETLAARQLVRISSVVQLVATVAIGRGMALLPRIAQTPGQCCVEAIWWGPISTCRPAPLSFWLYYVSRTVCCLHTVWLGFRHMHYFDAAERLDREPNHTVSLEQAHASTAWSGLEFIAKKYVSLERILAANHETIEKGSYTKEPGTVFSIYEEWACVSLTSALYIEQALKMYNLSGPGRWNEWGQSAQIIVATEGLLHWGFIRLTEGIFKKQSGEASTNDLRLRVSNKLQIDLDAKLFLSCRHGKVKEVQLALAGGANVNAREDRSGYTPLIEAATYGHLAIVRDLLDQQGVDVNAVAKDTDDSALCVAIKHGNSAIAEVLLRMKDIKPDQGDHLKRTPLSLAAARCDGAHIAQLLLQREDVNSDSEDTQGRTPLSFAAQRGQEETVRLLLGNPKVRADAMDKLGRTPLSFAAKKGHSVVAASLLATAQKVDANIKDGEGRSPLSWAAGPFDAAGNPSGRLDVAKMLLACPDVDLNSRDIYDRTPLLWAIFCAGKSCHNNPHSAMVELLLGRVDVDLRAMDNRGRTPVSMASPNGDTEMSSLIKRYINKQDTSRAEDSHVAEEYAREIRSRQPREPFLLPPAPLA